MKNEIRETCSTQWGDEKYKTQAYKFQSKMSAEDAIWEVMCGSEDNMEEVDGRGLITE